MKYEAHVSDQDVETGHRQMRGRCAVAQAIARENPQARFINVDREEIRLTDIDRRTRYCFETPEHVRQFIDAWDRGLTEARPSVELSKPKWRKKQAARTAESLGRPTVIDTSKTVDRRQPKKPSARSIGKRPLVEDAA